MNKLISFSHQIVTYSRHWKKHKISSNSPNVIMLIGSNNMVHLEVQIRNIINFVEKEWSMCIITSKKFKTKILQLVCYIDDNIKVIEIDELFDDDNNMIINRYNNMLCNYQFWKNYYYEKYMIITPDCYIVDKSINFYLENDIVLNSYYSNTIPKISNDIGNGGLIIRYHSIIENKLSLIDNINEVPKTIANFMSENNLTMLPEFYLYEPLIPDVNRYLLITNFIQLDGSWVHCPWKIGNGWEDHLQSIMTPTYNIYNDQTLLMYNDDTNNNLSLININLKSDNIPKNYWNGYIDGDISMIEIDSQLPMQKCMRIYSNGKNKELIQKYPNINITNYIDKSDLVFNNKYDFYMVYSNLEKMLNEYSLNGKPFEKLNCNNISNESKNIITFVDGNKSNANQLKLPQKNNIVVFLNDIKYIELYSKINVILYILPYSKSVKNKIKSYVRITKYNYFGFYQNKPCLFMGLYSSKTTSELHDVIESNNISKNKVIPYYVKQPNEQIEDEIIPLKVLNLILDGYSILTNNQTVCDYFNGYVYMYDDIMNKTTKFNPNNWFTVMFYIKNYLSLEYQTYIILSVINYLIKIRPVIIEEYLLHSTGEKSTSFKMVEPHMQFDLSKAEPIASNNISVKNKSKYIKILPVFLIPRKNKTNKTVSSIITKKPVEIININRKNNQFKSYHPVSGVRVKTVHNNKHQINSKCYSIIDSFSKK